MVTVSQRVQCQDPEPEAATWNSNIIHFIIYTCAFPPVTCQNEMSPVKKAKAASLHPSFAHLDACTEQTDKITVCTDYDDNISDMCRL